MERFNMKQFTVNYGQGNIEEREANNVWELAEEINQEGLPYNQSSIKILDQDDKEILIADWWGVEPDEDDDILQQIGTFGFFSPWREADNY